jgi:hypothetical protein
MCVRVCVRPCVRVCLRFVRTHPGIPTWLGLKDGIEFRCTNDVWQSYMQQWFQTVVEQVTPYFAVNGGPIVVVQVWWPPPPLSSCGGNVGILGLHGPGCVNVGRGSGG